jgi:hypothetical protein
MRIPEPWGSIAGATAASVVLWATGLQRAGVAGTFVGTFVGVKLLRLWWQKRRVVGAEQ